MQNPVNASATVKDTEIDRDSSRKEGPDYQPHIKFEYSFKSQQPSIQIQVNVTPENPGEAFIKARKSNKPLIFTGPGVLTIGPGAYRSLKQK